MLAKREIEAALDPSAPQESTARFLQKVRSAKAHDALVKEIDDAYTVGNHIIVSDQGSGMSQDDLVPNYLVIGTASRKKAIDAALASGERGNGRPPFLGEKGIVRLSAMRLGDILTVETARNVGVSDGVDIKGNYRNAPLLVLVADVTGNGQR